jgi:L-threonylcarbamoyladenylate synthase
MPVLSGSHPADVRRSAAHLAAGELLGFATETVYGLGADATRDDAVARVFAAKGRPADHPLIVHVASVDAAQAFAARWPTPAAALAQAFWPGPLTLIVPRRPGMAAAAAGNQDSIGLRMPAHPVALALLREAAALGVAGVAAPSANRFGRVSPTTAAHVAEEFGPALWVLDGGPCAVGIESAIVDCTQPAPALRRPGQLGRARLEQALGMRLGAGHAASPRAPGTLRAHYAPRAQVRLLDRAALAEALAAAAASGATLGVYSPAAPSSPAAAVRLWRPMPATAADAARELFAALRAFDAAGVERVLVEEPPRLPDWDGVRDRLQRAAAAG